MLRFPVTLLAAVLGLFLAFPPMVAAQRQTVPSTADVEVSAVRFRGARAEGQQQQWLEAEVELQARGGDAKGGAKSRYSDFVKIELMVGYDVGTGAEKHFNYFRSSVTAVALDSGKSVVRFYLPWEVVKRDGLALSEPPYWMAVVSVGDSEVPGNTRSVSTKLESAEIAQRFRQRVSTEGAVNDGVLVPQHDSPFAGLNLRDVPSLVRRGAR